MTILPPDPDHTGAGDPANWAAVEKLYREYQNDARRAAALILGSAWLRDDAEDVVHDAVVKAARSFRTLKDPARARGWFLTTVSRVALDRLRKRRRRYSYMPMVNIDITGSEADRQQLRTRSTALAPEQAAELQVAWEFINSLSKNQRVAYVLEHFVGLDRDDIGEVLGCSKDTVGTHIQRAQAKAARAFPPPTPQTNPRQVHTRGSTA